MKKIILFTLFIIQINFAQTTLPVGNLQITNDNGYNSSINSGNAARIDMGFAGEGYIKFGAHTGDGQRTDILYMRGSDGNVGIGTIVPTQKLEVNGNGIFKGSIISSISNDGGGKIELINPSKTGNGIARNWSIFNMTGSYGNSLQFWAYDNLGCGAGMCNNRFTIMDNGNVGIGTTSPSSKLDVVGEIRSYGVGFGQIDAVTSAKNYANFSSNNHGSVLLSSNLYFSTNDVLKIANTHGTMAGGAILLPGNSQPNQGKIQFLTTTPTSVTQDQLFAGTISMEITGNGNVGIGIINPSNKLDVNGTIHSKEVKIDMTGWSDFVFKKEYNLPTLEEVEKHIVEKGHLENIPSEKEVLKDGISLGEMNAKLLQKIEELTLYLIEQEKKNNKQSEEIDFLKKENKNFQSLLERITKLENQSK